MMYFLISILLNDTSADVFFQGIQPHLTTRIAYCEGHRDGTKKETKTPREKLRLLFLLTSHSGNIEDMYGSPKRKWMAYPTVCQKAAFSPEQ